MTHSALQKKHFSLNIASDVREICAPLLQHYESEMFLYARLFDDGTGYPLTNYPEFHKNHFDKEYRVTPPFPQKIVREQFYFFMTDNELSMAPWQPVLDDLRSMFGLWQTIYMIERYEKYYDLYIFSGKAENLGTINFFINNIDKFEKFKLYFKEKAKKIITASQKNKIIIPDKMRGTLRGIGEASVCNPLKKFIHCANKKAVVSPREMQCLQLLLCGHTMKEAAVILKISPRTVETHVNNIKHKFNLKKISQIFSCISSDLI